MARYRIVAVYENAKPFLFGNADKHTRYVIETKNFFGWKEIMRKEVQSKKIYHNTYTDAEFHMIINYMLFGKIKRIGNEYIYKEWISLNLF